MFFDHYPYTNFHNINLDWVLQAVKAWGQTVEANDRAFQDLKEANEDFKAYVTNYLQDLDITDEINTKLDAMLASGVLTPYFAPYVQGYVNSWLNSHVTPTSPALDNTLTLSGAAARADAVGHRLKDLAYIDALSTPEVVAALNRSQVLPGYRVQGITYDYDGHYYVCGGSVDEDGTGVIVKMTKPDFSDAEISVIPQLGHANDITYYDGYLYVCTVGGGNAPQWGIYKINVNDFTDKTLISNAPENTIGISYRQGDFWILAPYRIYRTTDFTSYEVVVANTNDLLTAYGIPTSGRISQTIFRAAGYLIGWVCSFVFEERHYGALTFFSSTGQPVAFKMFPAYHSELQCAVYADMSIWLLSDGNMVNVFRMDPRHLSYIQLKAGDDLNDFTGRGTLYSTGSNVSSELVNSPSAGEGFTVQVERLGVYNTIQKARTNSGRELYRVKSFSAGTWGEWIEPAAEVAQIKEDLLNYNSVNLLKRFATYTNRTSGGVTYTWGIGTNTCHAVGISNAISFTNLYSGSLLQTNLKIGDKVWVKVQSTKAFNLFLEIMAYSGETSLSSTIFRESKYYTVPENTTSLTIRVRTRYVTGEPSTVDDYITVEILNTKSNMELSDGLNNIPLNLIQIFPKYTTIGDSLMCGFVNNSAVNVSSIDARIAGNNWPTYIAKRTGLEFTNVAVGGSTTADWRVTHIDTANIDTNCYIIGLGINDLRQSLSVGTTADIASNFTANADSFYGNYDYIVRQLMAWKSEAHIMCLAIPTIEPGNTDVYNSAIKYIASRYPNKVHFVDLTEYTNDYNDKLIVNNFVNDHFNPIAYNMMSGIIERAINTYIYNNYTIFLGAPYV